MSAILARVEESDVWRLKGLSLVLKRLEPVIFIYVKHKITFFTLIAGPSQKLE